ncbi:MAG: adenylate cyclase [Treponema sp.]
MREIELKAWVEKPEYTFDRILQYADCVYRCKKSDSYWQINGKTIRIREEENPDKQECPISVTQKIKKIDDKVEINKELEFELPAAALPVFIEILKNTGFEKTAVKEKTTTVFRPHAGLFSQELLQDIRSVTIELSLVKPIGWFLELEVLYDEGSVSMPEESLQNHARALLCRLLDYSGIEQSAIEPLPYSELLHGIDIQRDCPKTESLSAFSVRK